MYLRTCRYYSFKVKLWRMKVTAYSPISPSCLAPASPPFSSPPPNEAPPKLKTELAAAADDDDGISNPLTDGGGAVAGLALAPLPKENPPAAGLAAPLPKEKPPAGLAAAALLPKENPPAGLAAPLPKENPPAGLVPLPKEKSLARLVH